MYICVSGGDDLMIRIVTDSTTDIPQDIIEKYGIDYLPLYVIIDGREYRDRIDISTDKVFEYMRCNVIPKTAQVSSNDTETVFRKRLQAGEDLIYIGFSSKMSGTFKLVSGILSKLNNEFPDRRIAAIDSRGGSLATGIITMRAAEDALSSVDFDTLVSRINCMVENIEHVFVITDLVWMIRGGRISKTLGYSAKMLKIRPILDVSNGEMQVIRKVQGTKRAMSKVADIVAERAKNYPDQMIGITHADDIEAAERMKELISTRLPGCSFLTMEIGPVLGVHIGIGGVGVFFLRNNCSNK